MVPPCQALMRPAKAQYSEAAAPSILLIGQELAAHRDAHAIALLVGLALDRHVEVDGAHDTVAEFLLDEGLPGRAVDLDQLVEAIDQGIRRHRRPQLAAIG